MKKTANGLVIVGAAPQLEVAQICVLCGEQFTKAEVMTSGGRFESHFAKCAEQHEDVIDAHRYDGEGISDTEAEQWTAKNAGLILEGRKTDVYGKKW